MGEFIFLFHLWLLVSYLFNLLGIPIGQLLLDKGQTFPQQMRVISYPYCQRAAMKQLLLHVRTCMAVASVRYIVAMAATEWDSD